MTKRQIVRSLPGRDKGGLFCVVGGPRAAWLLLADGKRRRRTAQAKKRGMSTRTRRAFDHPAIRKLNQAGRPVDRELRRALAAFRAEQGGNDAWRKTI